MIEQNQKPKNNSNSEETLIILKELTSSPHLTQRDLSEKAGISLGKTNYLLRELTAKGFVKIRNFSKKGNKLRKIAYILTPKGIREKTELTLHFLKRKQKEYEDLRREWENFYSKDAEVEVKSKVNQEEKCPIMKIPKMK